MNADFLGRHAGAPKGQSRRSPCEIPGGACKGAILQAPCHVSQVGGLRMPSGGGTRLLHAHGWGPVAIDHAMLLVTPTKAVQSGG